MIRMDKDIVIWNQSIINNSLKIRKVFSFPTPFVFIIYIHIVFSFLMIDFFLKKKKIYVFYKIIFVDFFYDFFLK